MIWKIVFVERLFRPVAYFKLADPGAYLGMIILLSVFTSIEGRD